MRDFPKISEGLERLYNDLYAPPTLAKSPRLKEILDNPAKFSWKVRKNKNNVPNMVEGMFIIPSKKTGENVKYHYFFDYTHLLRDWGWSFGFSRKTRQGWVMGTGGLSDEEKKSSDVFRVMATVFKIILTFIDQVQPYALGYEPYDETLEHAYKWMSKILEKRIIGTYNYEAFEYDPKSTHHYFYRKSPRTPEVIQKYPNYKDLVRREKVTLPDLMKNAGMSPKSTFFRKERIKIMGQEIGNSKFIECRLTRNGSMDFYFLAESTRKYKPGHKRKSADIKNGYGLKDNPSETYQITIRVLDFVKWLDAFPNKREITEKDMIDILMIANVEIDSDVPGWYFQGGTYWLQKLGGTIYKKHVRKPKKWNRPYPKGHGEDQYFLDKITQSIINSIRRYLKQMSRAATEELMRKGKLK